MSHTTTALLLLLDTTAPKTFTKCDHYAKEGLSLIPDKEVEICLHKEE